MDASWRGAVRVIFRTSELGLGGQEDVLRIAELERNGFGIPKKDVLLQVLRPGKS